MTDKLMIFDCDGVLVDSEVLAAMAVCETLRDCGIDLEVDQAINRYVGINMVSMLKKIEAEFARPLPIDFAGQIHANVNAIMVSKLNEIPGISAALDQMNGPRCVASSSSLRGIRRSLRVTKLLHHFAEESIFSAEMVDNGKPAPDLFLYAAYKMGVPAQDCIVIEDSIPGVTGAVAAGMKVIGFTGGSHIRDGHNERLRAAGAQIVFDNMRSLPELVSGL